MKPIKNTTQQPSASNFQTTFLADRGAVVLAEHALSLPAGTPARETIRLLLDRRADGQPFDPDETPAISRDLAITMLQESRGSAADLWEAVCTYFDVSDEDIDGEDIEAIMAEAA